MSYIDEDMVAEMAERLEDPKQCDSETAVEHTLLELFEGILPSQNVQPMGRKYMSADSGVVITRPDGSDILLTIQVQ